MGLMAGPVPSRVDVEAKVGLLDLVEFAVEYGGWSMRRTCGLLEVNDVRVARLRQLRAAGLPLEDGRPGPEQPLHAILDWERQAILDVYDGWADLDRSYRKLCPSRVAAGGRVRLGIDVLACSARGGADPA